MQYDPDNIFAKILRKEIPSECVYEDDTTYAFMDSSTKRPAGRKCFTSIFTCCHATPDNRCGHPVRWVT